MATISLKRPLLVLDFETTGVEINTSKIIQAVFIKIMPLGNPLKKEYLINPGVPIPPGATAVHGITDEMVKDQPNFAFYAPEILEFCLNCDFAGFNSNGFDIPLMIEEFFRCGMNFDIKGKSFLDVRNMYVRLKPRTLGAAYQEYTGKPLEGAHDAGKDVEATIEVLMCMIEQNEDLPKTIEELSVFANYDKPIVDLSGFFYINDSGVICFSKGKNKDKAAAKEMSYLQWLVNEPSFANNTKQVARSILKGEIF